MFLYCSFIYDPFFNLPHFTQGVLFMFLNAGLFVALLSCDKYLNTKKFPSYILHEMSQAMSNIFFVFMYTIITCT